MSRAIIGTDVGLSGALASALINHIASGQWADADADVRFEIRALLDAMIVKAPQAHGLSAGRCRPAPQQCPSGSPRAARASRFRNFRLMAAPPGAQPGLINNPPDK
jgi:hypothetical protein